MVSPGQVWVVALVAAMVAGCSPSTGPAPAPSAPGSTAASATATTPATTLAALGAEAPIGAVPWSQVGPGWTVAMWSPAAGTMPGEQPAPGQPTYANSAMTLYLVDPAGGRYLITRFPVPGDKGNPDLVDWSGDGARALFYARYATPPTVVSVDLHTGVQTTIPVAKSSDIPAGSAARYSRPDGKAVLVSTDFNGATPGTLNRLDMAGHLQLSYPTAQLGGAGQFSGAYLESADGTQLVLGTANLGNHLVPRTDNSLVVVRNDGTIVATLPAPMPGARCAPVRWWSSTVVLAHCMNLRTAASLLWEVPLDKTAPTALTAVNSGQESDPGFGHDLGDTDAWQLPSGTFLQSEGACGSMFLSRLAADGHSTKVSVPGVDNDRSVGVVGVSGDHTKLVLMAAMSCGPGMSLLTYDPATNASSELQGPPVNGGTVIVARPYPPRT